MSEQDKASLEENQSTETRQAPSPELTDPNHPDYPRLKPARFFTSSGKKSGRPTKYKPEYCKLLIDYFSTPATRWVITKHTNKKGDMWESEEEKANPVPMMSTFCAEVLNGIEEGTLLDWSKTFPDFKQAYTRARQLFSGRIADLASRGFLNPAFSIFLAKNTMEWTDKQQIEHKGSMEHSHFFEGMLQRAQEVGHEETRAIETSAKRLPEPLREVEP